MAQEMMDLGRRMGELTGTGTETMMRMMTLDWDCLGDVVDRHHGKQCTKLSLMLHSSYEKIELDFTI